MSTDCFVYCLDCKEPHPQARDANHQDELMLSLIRGREAIEGMAAVPCVELSTDYGLVYVDWFVRHHGHELVARSEYGDIKRIACTSKHPIWGSKCERADGHEGYHRMSIPNRFVHWSQGKIEI